VQSEALGSPAVDNRVWRHVLSDLPKSTPPWDRRVILSEEPEYLELQATARDLNAGAISGTRQRRLRVIRDVMRAHGIPAHADFIGAIVMDLLPGLFRSAFGVRRFLEWHPEEFQSEGDGVYSLMSEIETEPADMDELNGDVLELDDPESLSVVEPPDGSEELREV